MKFIVTSLLIALAVASSALAQVATGVTLDARSQAALENGARTRMIVQLELPDIAYDGAAGPADPDRVRTDLITGMADAVLQRVFDQPANVLSQPAADAPRLLLTFRHTPAMVMRLNQAELEALAGDAGVVRVVPDSLERPVLFNSVPQIGAALLHQTGTTGAGEVIAILDTGIDYDHPAFAGRIVHSACFSTTSEEDTAESLCASGNEDTTSATAATHCDIPEDFTACAHGTHVASIAAGAPGPHSSLGNYQLTGVAPDASIIPIQVFSAFTDESLCGGAAACTLSYVSDQLRALEWLYENRDLLDLDVINMSIGGSLKDGACTDDARAGIIAALLDADIPTTIASGNQGSATSVSSPGCIPEAVTVASADPALNPRGNLGALVDVLAPGVAIQAAFPTSSGSLSRSLTGTSMASPHAAGAIALLRSQYPDAATSDILEAIAATGNSINTDAGPVPFLRVDLASLYLVDRFSSPSGIQITGPASSVIEGYVRDPGSFSPLIYYVENNTADTAAFFVDFDEGQIAASFWTGTDWQTVDYDNQFPTGIPANSEFRIRLEPRQDHVWAASTGTRTSRFSIAAGDQFLADDVAVIFREHPPLNDDLADALPIAGLDTSFSVRFAGATYEDDEPFRRANIVGSVWYTFEPPYDGRYEITANDGPHHPYYIDLFTRQGNALTRLSDAASNASLQRDRTVYVQVHVPDEDVTEFGMRILFRTRDADGEDVWNPERLEGASGIVGPLTGGATEQASSIYDPAGGPQDARRGWYIWTAPYTGPFVISDQVLAGENRATSFAVFTRTDGQDSYGRFEPPSVFELVGSLEMSAASPDGEDDSASRSLSVHVEAGRTYWIRVGSESSDHEARFVYGAAAPLEHRLVAAVLPEVRAAQQGTPISAFMTLVNPARFGTDATNCRVFATQTAGRFRYWLADASNVATGPENPPFDIPSGGSQALVFDILDPGLTRPEANFYYICDNVLPTHRDQRLLSEEFHYVIDTVPPIDIISIAATGSGNGIVDVSNNRYSALSVASINNSSQSGDIILSTYATTPDLGPGVWVLTEVCETNPSTGQCITERAASSSQHAYEPGQVRTFTIFLRGSDMPALFQPGEMRVLVRFQRLAGQSTDEIVGATSVAIRTLGD